MDTISKRGIGHVALVLLALSACEYQEGAPQRVTEGLLMGDADNQPSSAAAVFLGTCSGVLINPQTVATVDHCLNSRAKTIPLRLRGGAEGATCLTPDAAGACGEWSLRVARMPRSEVVLLQSDRPFAGVARESLPLLATGEPPTQLRAHGFGFDSADNQKLDRLGRRLSAPMAIVHHDADDIYGRAPDGIRICGGDSGGPLMQPAVGMGNRAILAGLLAATEYDSKDPRCTSTGGLNRWTRLDRRFIEAHVGPCTAVVAGLDCSGTGVVGKPAFRDLALDRKVPQGAGLKVLREAGMEVFSREADVDDATKKRGRLMRLASSKGDFLISLPTARGALTAPVDVVEGGGVEPMAVPLMARSTAFSGGSDDRTAKFVGQVGKLSDDPAADGFPSCTATLIGPRLVRTARHCLYVVVGGLSMPYFTLRYNGGLSTVTYDGGQTYVTFRPVQTEDYYVDSAYSTNSCEAWLTNNGNDTNPSLAKKEACSAADWALLVLPADAWKNIHVVPAYMGLAHSKLHAVENTGYPSCSEVTSGVSCTAQKMYGMSCEIKVNRDAYTYSSCDISSGHSGGPVFYTLSTGSRYYVSNISNSDQTIIMDSGIQEILNGTDDGCGFHNTGCLSRETGTTNLLFNLEVSVRDSYNYVVLN